MPPEYICLLLILPPGRSAQPPKSFVLVISAFLCDESFWCLTCGVSPTSLVESGGRAVNRDQSECRGECRGVDVGVDVGVGHGVGQGQAAGLDRVGTRGGVVVSFSRTESHFSRYKFQ